jgi:aryl carrier-like protein
LRKQAGVREAVVVMREDRPGEKRLVGYVTPAGGEELDVMALRERLRQSLPDYMVPAAIIELEALPLMPNGKIDRRSLPKPPARQPADELSVPKPQTDVERLICQTWQSVLKVDQIGMNDNFFDLGGHSLAMVKIYHRLRKSLADNPIIENLQLVELFEHPTISALAIHLSRASQIDVEISKLQRRALRQQTALRRQKNDTR